MSHQLTAKEVLLSKMDNLQRLITESQASPNADASSKDRVAWKTKYFEFVALLADMELSAFRARFNKVAKV